MKKIIYSRGIYGEDLDEVQEEYDYIKEFFSKNNGMLVNSYGIDFWKNLKLNYIDSESLVYQDLYNFKTSDIYIANFTTFGHKHIGPIAGMAYAKMHIYM